MGAKKLASLVEPGDRIVWISTWGTVEAAQTMPGVDYPNPYIELTVRLDQPLRGDPEVIYPRFEKDALVNMWEG